MTGAARWAPPCASRQPWRFVIVAGEGPARPAVEASLDAGNGWAKRAPVLLVTGARKADGAVVEARGYFHHDTGVGTMSLLFRAADQGLLAHPMAGWKEQPLRAALSLPEDFLPIAGIAGGYEGRI